MERGYIKLWRKTLDSGLLQHPTALQAFMYLLLKTAAKPYKRIVAGQSVEVPVGAVLTSRSTLSADLGMTEKQARTALTLLEKLEIVTIKRASKYSMVFFVNWHRYQQLQPAEGPADRPAEGPSKGQVGATLKEVKNINTLTPVSNDTSVSVSRKGQKNSSSGDVLQGKRKKLEGKRKQSFEEFWEAFAYKKGKAEAIDAWAAIPTLTDGLVGQILTAARREAERRPETISAGRTPIYAQGWITGRRWEDEELSEAPRRRPEYLTNPNFGR